MNYTNILLSGVRVILFFKEHFEEFSIKTLNFEESLGLGTFSGTYRGRNFRERHFGACGDFFAPSIWHRKGFSRNLKFFKIIDIFISIGELNPILGYLAIP